jgi:hypothetical protein
MPNSTSDRASRAAGMGFLALIAIALGLLFSGSASSSIAAVVPTVPLGAAGSFAILSAAGITDVPTSVIRGNVGASPITGAAILVSCAEVTGNIYATDAFGPAPCSIPPPNLLATAKSNSSTAFGNASGRPGGTAVVGDQLGGKTLAPGVYTFGHGAVDNFTAGSTLHLAGSPSSVWIFQASSDFVTGAGSRVSLEGGAQACHVFWAVGSDATLNTGSTLAGTVLASGSIFVRTNVTVNGRLLAQTAAVTLDKDTITRSDCADTSASGGSSGPAPSREIYCDPVTGKAYDLEVGQDKQPPYDQLHLVPATVDPVTGAKSCTAAAAAVTTTTATTTTTTTTTSTATTSTTTTAPTPAPKPKPKATKPVISRKSGVAAATKARIARRAAAAKRARAVAKAAPRPQPARHAFGVTG